MNKTLPILFWLVPLLLTGCNMEPTPEPQTSLRAMAAAAKDLADTLQSVQDANSAQAATGDLDRKFMTFAKAYKELQRTLAVDTIKVIVLAEKEKFAPYFKDIAQDTLRIESEGQRIDALPDLPVEFWKAYALSSVNAALAMVEITLGDQDPNRRTVIQFLKDSQTLFRDRPYGELLGVQLLSADAGFVQKACDTLQKLAPDATLHRAQLKEHETVIFMAPAKDFKAVAAGVDFGTIIVKNESKRYLKIAPGHEESDDPDEDDDAKPKRKEAEDQAKRSAEEAQRKQEEATKQEEAERKRKEDERKAAAKAAEQAELTPDDPNYYDKLAEFATAGDRSKSEKAIDVLLTKSPADVPSTDTRKRIARGFKQLAENDSGPLKQKAIKGLVIWGGKYSGPILLKMLSTPQPVVEEQIIEALGELKYGPAVKALVARLADQRLRQTASKALQQLGEEAEDALIKSARSENPQISLAAVELLGDCGTRKCLSVLTKSSPSRSPELKAACKEAARKVKIRLKETRGKAKSDEA